MKLFYIQILSFIIIISFIIFYGISLYNNNRIIEWAKAPWTHPENNNSLLYCFRVNGEDQWALVYGSPEKDKYPLIRIQSQCVQGIELDDFGCDCKENLDISKKMMAENPNGGVIFILSQEGRSLGGIAKLREKSLASIEDQPTYDVVEKLGHVFDLRDYSYIPEALKIMGLNNSIRLITRFPARVNDIIKTGIDVVEVVEYPYTLNKYDYNFIKVNKCKYGYNFPNPEC
jgi:GTP cyclohydrolase II